MLRSEVNSRNTAKTATMMPTRVRAERRRRFGRSVGERMAATLTASGYKQAAAPRVGRGMRLAGREHLSPPGRTGECVVVAVWARAALIVGDPALRGRGRR